MLLPWYLWKPTVGWNVFDLISNLQNIVTQTSWCSQKFWNSRGTSIHCAAVAWPILLCARLSCSLSIVSVGTQKTTTIVCTRLNSCAAWAVQCRALVVLKLWDCTRIGSELNGGRIVWALSDFPEAFSEQQSKYEMFTYHGVHVLPLCYLACFMSAIIFIFLAWISSLPWPHNGVSEALRLSGHTRIW